MDTVLVSDRWKFGLACTCPPFSMWLSFFVFRQPQPEQPQIPAPEPSRALRAGGEGVPSGGHCGRHHAAGEDAAQPRAWVWGGGGSLAHGARAGRVGGWGGGCSLSRPGGVHQVALLFCPWASFWGQADPDVSAASSPEKAILQFQTQNAVPFPCCTHPRYNRLSLSLL